jgi:hypothetical protein
MWRIILFQLDTTGSFNWYRILNFAIEVVGEDPEQ